MSGDAKIHKAKLAAEIQALKRQDGSYAPSDIVDFARTHQRSELHKEFNWNKDEAARAHWLLTARHLITTYVVIIDKRFPQRIVPVISVPSRRHGDGGSYMSRNELLGNEEYRQESLAETKAKLRTIAETWEPVLPELAPVWRAVQRCC